VSRASAAYNNLVSQVPNRVHREGHLPTMPTQARSLVPSVDTTVGTKTLPLVLSFVAGATDIISFLGLGGLFTAHITGNLVILAAHLVSGKIGSTAEILSVPIFMLVVGMTRLAAAGFQAFGFSSLAPLLLLQFLLLGGCLTISVHAGKPLDPQMTVAIIAGMFAVAAMAVQNALVRVSLADAPTTAVMTTNITVLMIDLGNMIVERNPANSAQARSRASHTWPAVIGFLFGCGLGALCEAAFGLWALILPTGFAFLAFALSVPASLSSSPAASGS
jgi:uncharacterized membrane protein YoaK (UPF0700 family)